MLSTPCKFPSSFFSFSFSSNLFFFRKKDLSSSIFLPFFSFFLFIHKLNFFHVPKEKIISLVILNTTLDSSFFLNINLRKIYFGIGFFFSRWFSYLSGSSIFFLLSSFKKKKIFLMQRLIESHTFGDNFKKLLQMRYFIWKDLYHFQSFRKKKGLPIRGQTSRSNARSSKKNIFLKSIGL